MSTSLLYHGWSLRGYNHVRALLQGGQITFRIAHQPDSLQCSICGSKSVIRSGKKTRQFRSLPIRRKVVILELPIQRLSCNACGVLRQAKLGFADPRRTDTHEST